MSGLRLRLQSCVDDPQPKSLPRYSVVNRDALADHVPQQPQLRVTQRSPLRFQLLPQSFPVLVPPSVFLLVHETKTTGGSQ